MWFDLEGTLTIHTPEYHEVHDQLRHETYAQAVNKPVTEELKQEFADLYERHGSNSAIFTSLGLPSDHWQKASETIDAERYFKPEPHIFQTLAQLHTKVPISIFTNRKKQRIIDTFKLINIDPTWFTHILGGDDVLNRKPALDGFYAMIEKSQLPPEQILYVGDRVDVDIKPAKKVGIQTCLVWSKSEEADYSFEHFEDLLSLV